MNLKFDEKYLKDFEKALDVEWLQVNNLGAYSSS